MRYAFLIPLLLVCPPAHAAERRYFIADFDRIRIEGPLDVRLATRGAPAATVTGVVPVGFELHVDGTVLTVRATRSAGGVSTPSNTGAAPVVSLRTGDLHGVSVMGGGRLVIEGPVRGARIDLQILGSGAITAPAIDGEQLGVTVVGTGAMTLGGRAARARLFGNGTGTIDASALRVDALVLRLDGSGSAQASARYTADVVSSGLGAATVYGAPKCKVSTPGGAAVACGVPPPAAP
ncbi:DUF2807 domain-containing protein [Sphingomonas sp. RB3P16]|uniref:GIN domain-containing protein n=1 Tax=Parasphingomonas frigoris TaxID=3096163 RepID=UPI002FCADD74